MAAAIVTVALLFSALPSIPGGLADDPPQTSDASKEDPLAGARASTDREEWDDAFEKFQAFLSAKPDAPQAPEARFWAGFCLVKMGQNEKAVETLKPFVDGLSNDKWADDALLQLGNAYQGQQQETDALATWKLHLDKYPGSVWRTQVSLNTINLLFHHSADLAACLSYCEQLTKEVPDREATTEARYLGAYCLNALKKFNDSETWADRLFDPDSSLEEAWRRLLEVQRELLLGRVVRSLAVIDSLAGEFPDLDQDDRQDLLLKMTYLLRSSGQSYHARELLLAELVRSSGHADAEVDSLLNELKLSFGDGHEAEYLACLGRLSNDPKIPIVTRLSALERHTQALVESKKGEQAESLLRNALTGETAEFPRFRAGRKLAELLAENPSRRDEAVKILDQLREGLKRRDLIHQVQEALDRLRGQLFADHK
jgi:tetratricopeptide (TPR) repeat protein